MLVGAIQDQQEEIEELRSLRAELVSESRRLSERVEVLLQRSSSR